MSTPFDPDRRRPLPSNHVFQAHDAHDPTKDYFFEAFRDEDDTGVYVNFVKDVGEFDTLNVLNMMWLDADQCEQFGAALLDASRIIREADANDAPDGGGGCLMSNIVPIRRRAPLHFLVYADDLGDYTVAFPRSSTPHDVGYESFAKVDEARRRAFVIGRRNFIQIYDETLPDLGGTA